MTQPAPTKVRIAKLQDSQLDAVVSIDLACKAAMHRGGVPASELPARGLAGIAKLTKRHNVLVAEADGVVAGYVAWRDESPGVAYLEDLAVKPELQRHGIAAKLLAEVTAEAKRLSLPILLTRSWTKAASGRAFLEKSGLVPLDADAGERAELWRQEQDAPGGSGLAKEGQAVLYRALL
jgi:amino-acid N-acetyltransferase